MPGTHFDPRCVDAFRTALTRARESNEFLMMRTAVENGHEVDA